ncbi:hypothetical protein Tco_0921288 [Tanacetum coccineum]
MVAYLKKTKGSEGFHQIVDFLNASHIRYALTENPTIYFSLINQFWQTAIARTLDNGEIELTATIDGKVKIVTEASVRRHLQLADSDGISSLPTTKIFEQLSLMGYVSTSDKLTFQKGHFSPQWRFLIHTILHCLSPNNMKRVSKGYTGENIALFPAMIVQGPVVQGEGSTHPVESHHTPTSAPSTLQPPFSLTFRRTTRQESMVPQPRSPTRTPVADEAASTCLNVRYRGATTTITILEAVQGSGNIDKTPTIPHDSPLQRVNTLGSDEGSMTQQELMGRKITEIDQDPGISLVQHDAEIQGRYGHDMEFEYNFDAAKEVSTAEKYVSTVEPVSTAGAAVTTDSVAVSTASPTRNTEVSTADDITTAETLTKTKLQQEQKRLGFEAAVRLQAELKEEERQRIARRLQAEEREKYTEAEQARMLAELINQRKRYFVA